MSFQRVMQMVMGTIFGLATLGGLLAAIRSWDRAGPGVLLAVVIPAFMFVLAVGAFELQIRGVRRRGEALRGALEEIGAKLFDAPAVLRPGYDVTVTAGAAGQLINAVDTEKGFTVDGRCGDVRVQVASHVSVAGRQIGELSHVYSYVLVDMLGLSLPFRLTKQGAAALVARVAGMSKDVEIGDPAFDAAWNVDTDEALARAVLDDAIRARLMGLRSKVGDVSQDFGPGTMSLILTAHGLALRWPGEIDVAFARFIRDLLIDMRTRILAHVEAQAVRAGGAAAGVAAYRTDRA